MPALNNQADERLLVEAAKRDPRRFGELYELNFHRVYAYVVLRVPGREEAEDVTSEVFHHALKNLGRFEWRGVPFASWLYRIAANAITDRWQRTRKEPGGPALGSPAEDPPDPAAEQIEKRAILAQLVENLPEDQKRVVIQRFLEQKSIKEIAQELGRSEGAVKQLQFRALENLRSHMEGAHE